MALNKKLTKTKIVQLLMTYVGCILYIVCFATPSWIVYYIDTKRVTSSLFRICNDDKCNSIVEKDKKFTAAQVSGCLGLVSYICFSTTATLAFIHSKYFKAIKLAAFVSSLSAGTFVAISLLLILQSDVAISSSLGYSGIIGVVSVFIALILCPFHTVDLKQIGSPKTRREDKKPLHTNIAPIATTFEEGGILSTENKQKIIRTREAWTPEPSLYEFDGNEQGQNTQSVNPVQLVPVQPALLYQNKRENTISDIFIEDFLLDNSEPNQQRTGNIDSEEATLQNKPTSLLPFQLHKTIYFNNSNFINSDFEVDEFDLNEEAFIQPQHITENPLLQCANIKWLVPESKMQESKSEISEDPSPCDIFNEKKNNSISTSEGFSKERQTEQEEHSSTAALPFHTQTIMYADKNNEIMNDDFDIDEFCEELDNLSKDYLKNEDFERKANPSGKGVEFKMDEDVDDDSRSLGDYVKQPSVKNVRFA